MSNKAKIDLYGFIDQVIRESAEHSPDGLFLDYDDLNSSEKISITGRFIAYEDYDVSCVQSEKTSIGKLISDYFTGNNTLQDFSKVLRGLFEDVYRDQAQALIDERIKYLESL